MVKIQSEGLSAEVQKLLMNKYIIIVGDSNHRTIYKDLVLLLQKDDMLSHSQRRAKGEMSFEKDALLEGGVKGELNNGIRYKEVREYVTEVHLVKFYFVTRCYNYYMEDILQDVNGKAPDLFIMNSCLWDLTRYEPNPISQYSDKMETLCDRLVEVLNPQQTLFIWNSTLPVSKQARGGVLVPEVMHKNRRLTWDIVEANFVARKVVVRHGLHVLDLHYWFRNKLDMLVHDGVHWSEVAHRLISFLLLTNVSHLWDVPFPAIQIISDNPVMQRAGFVDSTVNSVMDTVQQMKNLCSNVMPPVTTSLETIIDTAQRMKTDCQRASQNGFQGPVQEPYSRPVPYRVPTCRSVYPSYTNQLVNRYGGNYYPFSLTELRQQTAEFWDTRSCMLSLTAQSVLCGSASAAKSTSIRPSTQDRVKISETFKTTERSQTEMNSSNICSQNKVTKSEAFFKDHINFEMSSLIQKQAIQLEMSRKQVPRSETVSQVQAPRAVNWVFNTSSLRWVSDTAQYSVKPAVTSSALCLKGDTPLNASSVEQVTKSDDALMKRATNSNAFVKTVTNENVSAVRTDTSANAFSVKEATNANVSCVKVDADANRSFAVTSDAEANTFLQKRAATSNACVRDIANWESSSVQKSTEVGTVSTVRIKSEPDWLLAYERTPCHSSWWDDTESCDNQLPGYGRQSVDQSGMYDNYNFSRGQGQFARFDDFWQNHSGLSTQCPIDVDLFDDYCRSQPGFYSQGSGNSHQFGGFYQNRPGFQTQHPGNQRDFCRNQPGFQTQGWSNHFGHYRQSQSVGQGSGYPGMPQPDYSGFTMPRDPVPAGFYNSWTDYANDSFVGAHRRPQVAGRDGYNYY